MKGLWGGGNVMMRGGALHSLFQLTCENGGRDTAPGWRRLRINMGQRAGRRKSVSCAQVKVTEAAAAAEVVHLCWGSAMLLLTSAARQDERVVSQPAAFFAGGCGGGGAGRLGGTASGMAQQRVCR